MWHARCGGAKLKALRLESLNDQVGKSGFAGPESWRSKFDPIAPYPWLVDLGFWDSEWGQCCQEFVRYPR